MGVSHSIYAVEYNIEVLLMTFMFLGHAKNHTVGTYCMFNLHMKYIVLSRDATWLNKT